MNLFNVFDEDNLDGVNGIELDESDKSDEFGSDATEDGELVQSGYTDGGNGFVRWCNDFVYVNSYENGQSVWKPLNSPNDGIHPISGKRMDALWVNQQEVCRQALKMEGGRFIYSLIVLCWNRGEGKCERKGSKLLTFSGEVKKVEDVVVGDLLMGDDNTPRKVLSLASGKEEMFEVVPNRGEPKVVTLDHILSLKRRRQYVNRRGKPHFDPRDGQVVDISLRSYLKQSKSFKNLHLLYSVPVDFPEQLVWADPYFLGLWLADGTSTKPSITTMDQEVVNYLKDYAGTLGLRVTVQEKKGSKANTYSIIGDGSVDGNVLLTLLKEYELINNKHIPQVYKVNSRDVRMQLLAGIVDGDGYANRNSIQIIFKSKQLSEDTAFLARSLGFHVIVKKCKKGIKGTGFVGEYYRIGISGDCSVIPTRVPRRNCTKRSDWKDVLVTGIKEIRSVGEHEYYGFTLDGNGRYLSSDFTVMHNSFVVCLIQLWKFFNFKKQTIVLGANSKDQTKFVHYDIMRDIILNSPKLLAIVGRKNVQEKEIILRDGQGRRVSSIRSITTSSGIVSNIAGYTFSEMFDMKNPKFFIQLDGSIRNIPNALGTIDSTVSSKEHILYKLYLNYKTQSDPKIFFSHRQSIGPDYRDFWHPEMTEQSLKSYEVKFPAREFAMYFKNTWDAGSMKMFPSHVVDSFKYIGFNGSYGEFSKICSICKNEESAEKNLLIPTSSLYSLSDEYGYPRGCDEHELSRLEDFYDTNFAILAGIDRADPMKLDLTTGARTIVTIIAKGLPGSRSNVDMILDENRHKNYLYLLLNLIHIETSDMETIKQRLEDAYDVYGSIETLCTERWGMWDFGTWCEKRDIIFEAVSPSYDRQKDGFSELFHVCCTGRFKSPRVYVRGSKKDDILEEEFKLFDHAEELKFYGSPEKSEKYGTQDDVMYSLCWGIYGGRFFDVHDFPSRNKSGFFGAFIPDKSRYTGRSAFV